MSLARKQLVADERRSTPMKTRCSSAFIGVHRRPINVFVTASHVRAMLSRARALTWLLLALSLAPAAHAQFGLFVVEGSTERAAPAVYDFGSLYADESASDRKSTRLNSSHLGISYA